MNMSPILPGLAVATLAAACFGAEAEEIEHRGAYSRNGQIHVGLFRHPDGPPLTTGHGDCKPSWSKTGDRLVFFRAVKEASPWRTAICVIKTDGTGFNQLTDGTHSDMNPTWTRDGANLVVFNRHNDQTRRSFVMHTRHDARPGDEYAVSDTRRNTLSYTCLIDGRILVSASAPHGYYLMTPARDDRAKYEPIECELAKRGQLDRISVSPSETKVCFELRRTYQGEYRFVGHVLYIADFDVKARTITNAKVIANAEANPARPFLYPRWTRDESAVLYHANLKRDSSLANDDTGIWIEGNQLYMYHLEDGSTVRVSTDPNANYMFPHGEKTPK
jgi:hypothetical protein